MGSSRSRSRTHFLVFAALVLVPTVFYNVKLAKEYGAISLELTSDLFDAPRTQRNSKINSKSKPLLLSVPFYVYEELAWMNATYGGEPVHEKSQGQSNKHFNDYYFAKASLSHPLRTRDPSKAQLFVVPILMNFFGDRSFSKKQLRWNNLCDKHLLTYAGKVLLKSP
jgi:hypothetical protein